MSDITFGWDFDDLNGYSYHINYWKDFFDVGVQGTAVKSVLERDFVFNLGDFINGRFSSSLDTSFSIAKSTFTRMTSPELRFHNALHPLSILRFAFDHQITLSDWEQIAIWFHAGIYFPGAANGLNEMQSVSFMRAMLPDGLSCENLDLNQAERGILSIGRHAEDKVEGQYALLADMDLCHLSWPFELFKRAEACLEIESVTEMSERRFKIGLHRFYRTILQRKHIYRTTMFQERFEEAARENMQLSLPGYD